MRSPACMLPLPEWRPHISRIERRRGQDMALWVKRRWRLGRCELLTPLSWLVMPAAAASWGFMADALPGGAAA